MERNILVDEIISFCFDYGVKLERSEVKENIEQGLESAELVESFINMIFIKAKKDKNTDIKRIIELLLELERIRLELEFKDHNLVLENTQSKHKQKV